MKIVQNDSAHELARMLQASSKFDFIYLFIYFYFDDLHLQIIESISPKASVENSSAQWAICFINLILRSSKLGPMVSVSFIL